MNEQLKREFDDQWKEYSEKKKRILKNTHLKIFAFIMLFLYVEQNKFIDLSGRYQGLNFYKKQKFE